MPARRRLRPARSVPLEILDGTLVALRRRARLERAEIAPLAGLRVGLARIQTVFAAGQLADHACSGARGARSALPAWADAAVGARRSACQPSGKMCICSQRPLEFSMSTSSWQ